MRRQAGLVLGVLLLAGCQREAAQAPAPGEVMPTRRAGLWREVVTVDGGVQRMRICLDEAAARRLNLLGDELGQYDCVANRTWREGDHWAFEHSCNMLSDGLQEVSGRVRGDLQARFSLTATSEIQRSQFPKANGTHQTTIEGTYEGPCPAGWRPGEVELENGERFSVLNTRPVR